MSSFYLTDNQQDDIVPNFFCLGGEKFVNSRVSHSSQLIWTPHLQCNEALQWLYILKWINVVMQHSIKRGEDWEGFKPLLRQSLSLHVTGAEYHSYQPDQFIFTQENIFL